MLNYCASEFDKPDSAVTSLFGTTYIDFAIGDSIVATVHSIKPPYYCCGVRLHNGRGVWVVAMTYSDCDIAYFWDWRAARDLMRQLNA